MALENENNTVDAKGADPSTGVAGGDKNVSAATSPVPQGAVNPNLAEDPFMRSLGIAGGADASNSVNSEVNPVKPVVTVGEDVATATDPVLADESKFLNTVPKEQESVQQEQFVNPEVPETSFPEPKNPVAEGFNADGNSDLPQQTGYVGSDEANAIADASATYVNDTVPDTEFGDADTVGSVDTFAATNVLPGTITVNDTSYAVSVFWQPLQNPDEPLPEVREAVANVLPDANVYVLRTSGVPQYGLGLPSQGHKPGMPVAALSALDAFQDLTSVVAVFKVPEGWWFLAIRNGLILAEEDILYSDEEDAKRNFLSMMAVPDWGRRIAPASWGVSGTEEVDINTLFASLPKVKFIRLKKELSITTVAIVVGVLVVLGIVAFAVLSRLFNTTEAIQEVVAPPPPVVKPVVEEPKVIRIPMPWESLVVPSEFVKVCADSVTVLTSSTIPGWSIGDIRCQESGLSTSWSMQWGRVGNFLTVMNKYKIEGLHYTVAKGGRSATGTIHFNQLRKAASNPTMTAQEITDELTDMFQAIAMPVQLSVTDVRPAGAVAGNPKNARKKANKAPEPSEIREAYSYVNFSFSSSLPVSEWSYFFDKFGALELTSLLYNKASNNWKYEGRIYGKNK